MREVPHFTLAVEIAIPKLVAATVPLVLWFHHNRVYIVIFKKINKKTNARNRGEYSLLKMLVHYVDGSASASSLRTLIY